MKWVIAALIILLTTFIGKKFADRYKERREFFKEYAYFLSEYLRSVTLTKKTKSETAAEYGRILPLTEDSKAVEQINYLTKDEKELIKEFLDVTGGMDSFSAKTYVLSEKERADKWYGEAKERAAKMCKTCVILGLAIGAIIVLVII